MSTILPPSMYMGRNCFQASNLHYLLLYTFHKSSVKEELCRKKCIEIQRLRRHDELLTQRSAQLKQPPLCDECISAFSHTASCHR